MLSPHLWPAQECRLNRPSSAAQLQTRIESALAGSPCLGRDRLSREPGFIVAHYAGPVRYHTAGLVEKNKVRPGPARACVRGHAHSAACARQLPTACPLLNTFPEPRANSWAVCLKVPAN